MKKPNFLCVGAQKAGTTTLYDVLKQHPQIFLPSTKELHFFDWETHFSQGKEWYLSHFKDVQNEKAIGEITPNYMYINSVPKKIYDFFGKDIKLIFILRNPVKRAYSHYLMKLRNGRTDKSFYKEIKIDKIEKNKEYMNNNPIIGKSLYDTQINRYLEYFDQKNMLFLIMETDLIQNRDETFKKIFRFLNVDNKDIKKNIKSNKALQVKNKKINQLILNDNFLKKIIKPFFSDKSKAKIKNSIKKLNKKSTIDYSELEKYSEFLNEKIFKQSIIKVEKIINRDLSFWLD